MDISVILCTYNRSASLSSALESLVASELPEGVQWEVLVVDNNSKDQTRAVAQRFCGAHPQRFRYIFEPMQGKSHALNTGIREARGNILAFIDDDVTVEPTWMGNLTGVFEDKQWAGSAGRIRPARSFEPPPWLALSGPSSLLGALCAYFDPGDLPDDLKDAPFGANMAYRREMFEKYGTFRIDLGPCASQHVSSEDTEFGRRLLAGGERLRYVPTAIVYHEIHQARIQKGFFLSWWFGLGRGSVRGNEKNLAFGQFVKVALRTALTAAQWLLAFEPKRRFYLKCRVWFNLGKFTEAMRKANSRVAEGGGVQSISS